MIIRSQDKAMIVNFDTTRELYKTGSEIWLNTDNGISKIGTYSTEEKAIKVLDMICEEYKKYTSAKGMSTYFAFIQPKVFQMPSDESVEV